MGALSVHGEEASISQARTHSCPGFCGPTTFTVGGMILDSSSPNFMLLCTGHTHAQCSFLVEKTGEGMEMEAAETWLTPMR